MVTNNYEGRHMTDRELLEAVHLTVVTLAGEVKEACKDVTTLNHAVFGNHKIGLVQDHTITKTKLGIIMWVGGIVTTAVIGLLVTSVWQLIAK
jgi:hypothetical protein